MWPEQGGGNGNSAFKIFTGKPTGKRPLGRPRRKWEGNIRMYLKEIGNSIKNWINSAEVRDKWAALVNTVIL